MGIFRSSPEVRTAQAALNNYSDRQNKAGNHEETDEYLRLNDNVDKALKRAKKR